MHAVLRVLLFRLLATQAQNNETLELDPYARGSENIVSPVAAMCRSGPAVRQLRPRRSGGRRGPGAGPSTVRVGPDHSFPFQDNLTVHSWCAGAQSDKISCIDMADDRINTIISHIISPYPILISH